MKGKLVFQEQSMSETDDLVHGYVEVQIQASGLTREGVLVVTGSDYPTTFSYEIGGTNHENWARSYELESE